MNIRKARPVFIVFLSILFFFQITSFCSAEEKSYGTVIPSRIQGVYDGDTFRCDIDYWPSIIGDNISVRLGGVDAPEMKDKRPAVKALAIKARDHLASRLREAKMIELRNLKRGKYFRLVADVYVDGESLAQEMIRLGLAYEYDGGTKKEWGEVVRSE